MTEHSIRTLTDAQLRAEIADQQAALTTIMQFCIRIGTSRLWRILCWLRLI